jgi:hypothetical protein
MPALHSMADVLENTMARVLAAAPVSLVDEPGVILTLINARFTAREVMAHYENVQRLAIAMRVRGVAA